MQFNCIIVDDEPRAIEIMEEYVQRMESLNLMASFRNPIKAFDFLKQQKVDVVFLDINMPNLSGIQLIKSLNQKPKFVLTTAYSEYAVESYQLDVVDYLLKPIEFDRFVMCVDKLHGVMVSKNQNVIQTDEKPDAKFHQNHIFVKHGTKIDRIDLDSILFLEGSGNYVNYQLDDRKVMALGKMGETLDMLPQDRFVRIHKSYIVQLSRIDVIMNNRVHLGESKLPISGSYREAFFAMVDKGKV
ncbi:LytR/AlgR family response regulator transcription factor [Flagellimonas nanhaiensis]|uniref:DNA-binding response regulator n=1 Tax=Flagellimonas nanhaiensis TaxID=2292706 RepID=A0A371JQG5_9FLAO|nr:response regulator transcription factor [Allomuricauda nanhaiensis]RDY59755.1 DNA-binding response regulator [Allomuricauda nanhaiensis]